MGDFDGAGTKEGMEVWRIENKVPVPVPPKMYGQFYEGDSYICLKSTKKGNGLSWDLFFWLGAESSTDEQGIAAYKTVELDEQLGGAPVQHREAQGFESNEFMQAFKSVQYLKGGVASGFNHVERDVYETRLLHLKGARMVRVSTVPLSASSLNAGDVFILDKGMTLIQWNGSEANRKEKSKALEVVSSIKDDERGGKARITVCDQGSEPAEFWEALGGRGAVAPAVDDAQHEKTAKGLCRLIHVSDASGELVTTEIASGKLTRDMLVTDDVFIMDNGAEIFVWVGKGASGDERKGGVSLGSQYCSQAGRPKGTKVTKVMEGTEPTTFKSNFVTWSNGAPLLPGSFQSPSKIAKSAEGDSAQDLGAQMSQMQMSRSMTRETVMSLPKGTTQVWRIEGFDKVAVEGELLGQFYAGDSYIVQYSYKERSKEIHIIYFWLGSKSTADEKGAAALLAKDMDDQLGGAATQVRVTMGKEPLHFIQCFEGKMVVHSGGKASGFKNRADTDSYDEDGVSLYHVRGSDEYDTRAVQVEEKASSLNSGDCFVLLTPSGTFLWKGSGANDSEKEIALTLGEWLKGNRSLEDVAEGSEPEAFWSALGGQGEYPSGKVLAEASREAMLFSCSNATGVCKIEPVFDFAQADLVEEDVFILDSFTSVFVWTGSEANDQEKAMAFESAVEYIRAQNYAEDTPIVKVRSGSEPAMFTCHFLGWDHAKKAAFVDPYEAKLAAIAAANAPEEEEALPPAPPPQPKAASFVEPDDMSYSLNYDDLKKPADQLPSGVDPSKRETYLSDADFQKVLGSPRGEFMKLKPWKQSQLKKAAGLF